ncbi:hypothetical protein KL930_003682 [Ogataea haglerorum]|uniref:Mitochondrial distribution and morphology protein 31 n=1 Tax=Ogataea haglerorum TaxID=1937702 RepID=A0AAN6D5E7_9ASCO|nr:uncharacterized protein KL911_003274 [Ogataea haglerorum]KAG7695685.1 hypothetical protein KL915_003075 [Ogataea haglerorum]KAG7696014.1 hypothetical protein KL951_003539 [Ogataea haglerorum]KAG7705562.1 hypothetical protein KL914_003400 [Ogataea haglerorum]KAG7707421.1 hypothetical protein KL950_003081 [Ogataea haglerorum]KAG7727466.1 hypothetical protein KL933_002400 [Ogataea haglerorum]
MLISRCSWRAARGLPVSCRVRVTGMPAIAPSSLVRLTLPGRVGKLGCQFYSQRRVSRVFEYVYDKCHRLRWALVKSKRPLNNDDFSAIFSWLMAGNIAFLIIGTTSFFSLLLYTMNTVLAQEMVAEFVGNVITRNSALSVTFDNAIVPNWKDGKIQFNHCVVSRRPRKRHMFRKKDKRAETAPEEDLDDGNYTQFDLTIDQIDISLSFGKWLSGKGIIDNCSLRGVRGVVDRTHVYWKPGDSALNYKNVHRPGDWEISDFRMQDLLVTMHNPNNFRSFDISVYNCELPLFRKNWLFFDILNGKHINGCYDGALFTIDRVQTTDDFRGERQIGGEVEEYRKVPTDGSRQEIDLTNKTVTRLRIDNLPLEHLNGGMKGPFGWIYRGTVDMIGDVIVPENASTEQATLRDVFKYYTSSEKNQSYDAPFIMDFYLRLNNPKASVPLFPNELSYVNSALIRPIVGYINSRKTFIPIYCRVYKQLKDFDGSWTVYDSLLMDDLSVGVYNSFVEYLSDEQFQREKLRKVGFWSLQFMIQLILWSLSSV